MTHIGKSSPGANELDYTPTDITQNTCFLRCVRRAGCDMFIESNIINMIVDTDCLAFDRFGVSIGDKVWEDLNGDGIQNADEPGIANVWINLQDENGNSLQWTHTNESGKYIFFGLFADTYRLQVSTPDGFEPSPAHESGNDEDSDFDPITGLTPMLHLLEGDHARNVDAGFRPAGVFLANNANDFQLDAVKGDEHTELYWTHNAGEDVEEYVVERSANGGSYEELMAQPSQGGNNAELYFGYDLEPVTGDNFYRIKMLNTDGSIIFSEPILVHFADLVDFTVFPNPASDFVKINLETLVGQGVNIQLVDGSGKPVHTTEIEKVYSKYHQIDLRTLKEGHYVVWVQPVGHKAIAKQVIIGRP